jgi:hypothetical protein
MYESMASIILQQIRPLFDDQLRYNVKLCDFFYFVQIKFLMMMFKFQSKLPTT